MSRYSNDLTVAASGDLPGGQKDRVHLRILATSDIHMHLHPWDYTTARPTQTQSLARIAALVADARAEAETCILLDNGDFLQGSPMGDWVAHGRGLAGRIHPVAAAMNHMRYDAATVGNHEFNYGIDFLSQVLGSASFPFVSANISRVDGTAFLPRWTVLTRPVRDGAGTAHDLRIGIIGFAPPQIMTWDRAVLEGVLTTNDIVAAAREHVPALRRECDIVIALSHSGIAGEGEAAGAENASAALAAVPGIDAVVAGHSHQIFPSSAFDGLACADVAQGTLHGTPAVMPGFWGSHLGVIDLVLRPGDWQVTGWRCHARSSDGLAPDADFLAVTATDHDETVDFARRPVGETLTPLNTFFGMVAPTPAVALIAEAGAAHAQAVLGDALPVLGTGLPFKAGGRGGPDYFTDIPAGPIALRHVTDIYCYPNSFAVLRLSGAEVAGWLERAAAIFNRIEPGIPDQPLLPPEVPSYNFDLIHGLTFRIDLARQTDRIRDLHLNGEPLDRDAMFHVATSSYRAGGTGGFSPRPPVLSGPATMREVLMDRIATHPPSAGAPPFWSFMPMPGTSVTFDTSPRAIHHLHEVPHLSLTPLGTTERGFLRFRLDL
ncbi:bifunctional 2',3'-cyclic-nucleotide 2'-phosphodiesterase/3'-nucleotidase [Falsirhodobacter xinxiangensis]|uniref:bifunctional 2',3'-cyclic-nucleotide 2'-phosphodiesterase/3'-nucleotidase n=1 Tax=Falsirhodobacter xinxiangensis TaxID=2530049 RepID=UPI0010AB3347|nr:bifunctional 2',3'-cyclic-nucleotide 2'-phosphodiesterase/3'-nucleotidase [Rhodobacter xinxiangensis]